jgi:transposase
VAAGNKRRKRMSAQLVEDEDYQLRYEVVAGIDVAKESAVVCVRMPPAEGRTRRTSHLREVPATVPAITALAADLRALGMQMASLESTSDYWRVWFVVLEEAGLDVQLVNSSQARNLPGRPKTDLLTELPDVSAVQAARASLWPIVGLSRRSRWQAAPAMTQA